jgi:hypothetical protein
MTTKKRVSLINIFGVFLMMGASVGAQAGLFGIGGVSWKEEVLLHDGSKIVVERKVERGGRHEIGQQPPYKVQSLSFTFPGTTQEIVWEDNFSEDVGSANFLPMLLDIRNTTSYLVVSPMGCLSYNKWGRPNPPYVVFRYQGKEWQRIPLQELPADIRSPNLIFSDPDPTNHFPVPPTRIPQHFEGAGEDRKRGVGGELRGTGLLPWRVGWSRGLRWKTNDGSQVEGAQFR